MNFIIITGPMAVGKMAVGMALAELTNLRIFHNHMTIEPVIRLFPYGSKEAQHLIGHFREEIFQAMVHSDQPGMIFTYVCDFDDPHDKAYMMSRLEMFEEQGAQTYLVELEADLEVRVHRNSTPLRLEEKPSKRDVATSEERMLKLVENHRLNSDEGEIQYPNYLRIDNSTLSPEEVATIIVERFGLVKWTDEL